MATDILKQLEERIKKKKKLEPIAVRSYYSNLRWLL